MHEIRFTNSRVMAGVLAGGCLVLAAASFGMIVDTDSFGKGMGWIGITFFSLCGLWLLPGMLKSEVQVIINQEGIEDLRNGIGLIRWKDIRSIDARTIGANRFLSIVLSDEAAGSRKISLFRRVMLACNRNMGLQGITLNFTLLVPGLDAAVQLIRDKYPEKLT